MYIKYIVTLITITILVAACTTSKVTVEGLRDPHKSNVKVHTTSYFKPNIIIGGSQDWYLKADIDKKTKRRTFQLYVTFNSDDWVYWDRARFSQGRGFIEYPVKRIGVDVDCPKIGCAHYEDVVLQLSEKTLRQWSQKNSIVRFSSSKSKDYRDVQIEFKEVAEFMSKIRVVLASSIK